MKLYHTKTQQKVSFIPCNDQDPNLIRVNWFDRTTLAISNTVEIKIVKIRETTPVVQQNASGVNAPSGNLYAEVVVTVYMPDTQVICGIVSDPRSPRRHAVARFLDLLDEE